MTASRVLVLFHYLLWKAKLDLSALNEGFDSLYINVSVSTGFIASCGVMKTPSCIIQRSVCVIIPFILDIRLVDAPAGVTQKEGRTGFRLPSAIPALIVIARRIQPSLFLVDCEVEFCVPTN